MTPSLGAQNWVHLKSSETNYPEAWKPSVARGLDLIQDLFIEVRRLRMLTKSCHLLLQKTVKLGANSASV